MQLKRLIRKNAKNCYILNLHTWLIATRAQVKLWSQGGRNKSMTIVILIAASCLKYTTTRIGTNNLVIHEQVHNPSCYTDGQNQRYVLNIIFQGGRGSRAALMLIAYALSTLCLCLDLAVNFLKDKGNGLITITDRAKYID